jgi:hypothetical protein
MGEETGEDGGGWGVVVASEILGGAWFDFKVFLILKKPKVKSNGSPFSDSFRKNVFSSILKALWEVLLPAFCSSI